ncbi:MAG: beta-ketoacyl-[acyl-carrier-protein] synthase family protein, partial [Terriglobales bacterium]
MEKVVITGMGVLSACGSTPAEMWARLAAGRGATGPVTRVDPARLAHNVCGEVRGFDPAQHFGKEVEILDRFAQFAVVCARRALADAGLEGRFGLNGGVPARRAGVVTGTALGGVESEDYGFHQLYARQATRLHPYSIPRMMFNAATSHVSMDTGAQGVSFAVSTACASSTHALGEAWRLLRLGAADVMLAGGADAPLTLGVFKAWEAMRVLAPAGSDPAAACRPFSADRAGLVLAEGAAMFVLETESSARRRGARVWGELAGYGASADAGHITQPTLEGPLSAMREAMAAAGLEARDLDYINAHGTGTKLNDATESAAIRALLGGETERVSVSSTKSMHGHAMGASGAVELAATLLAIQQQTAPPTANYTEPDPACDIDVTPNQARPREIRAALSNSFAFGGLNAVLAVKKVGTEDGLEV